MIFEWDEAKSETNLHRRGFDFALAALIFDGPTVERIDSRRDYGEIRVQAIGEVAGTILFVVYTDRAETRRIISARVAKPKERKLWLSSVRA